MNFAPLEELAKRLEELRNTINNIIFCDDNIFIIFDILDTYLRPKSVLRSIGNIIFCQNFQLMGKSVLILTFMNTVEFIYFDFT